VSKLVDKLEISQRRIVCKLVDKSNFLSMRL